MALRRGQVKVGGDSSCGGVTHIILDTAHVTVSQNHLMDLKISGH
jgi:hypothetical protein